LVNAAGYPPQRCHWPDTWLGRRTANCGSRVA
jgi:hypothetical protein